MLKSAKVQMIVMLAIGGLLGYFAASGKLGALGQVNGEQSRESVANKEGGSAQECVACSPEGLTKGQLIAMADPKVKEAIGKAQEKTGGKPNILFIMGDDIGWMQPGCYHRGLMVGETPNIDRIANEGALFMDYV